jgi:hypothetical protein
VVSNQHDACPVSPLWGGKRLAEHNHFDFIAVDSAEDGGFQADCGGHSPHGFLGIAGRRQSLADSENDRLPIGKPLVSFDANSFARP